MRGCGRAESCGVLERHRDTDSDRDRDSDRDGE